MPLPVPPRGPFRRALYLVTLLLLVALAYAFFAAGRFLAAEDPLEKADAIMVLSGSRFERPLEAADLYRAGWAPRILMTHQTPDVALSVLNARGLGIPADADLAVNALVRDGVPADVFLLPDRIHDNTAQEAETLRELAQRLGWRRVIVVSSKFHLRRAGFAMERALAGTGIEIRMRGSRYDPSDPPRWWRTRRDIRWMLSEAPKLIAYVLGLGA